MTGVLSMLCHVCFDVVMLVIFELTLSIEVYKREAAFCSAALLFPT